MKRALSASLLWLAVLSFGVLAELNPEASSTSVDGSPNAWKSEWAVSKGFSIEIDTEGYHYPTAIAFVPNPGDDPKDPLYFVTELRGKVKVVTNDRTVYTFADDVVRTSFQDEFPRGAAEFGLAGICLAPAQGYVFVTFAYQGEDKILRNNIVRFETEPETFALEPTSQQAFTDVFAPYESGPSHQIGTCKVHDDLLYVGIGDGYKTPAVSQQLDILLGKIARMDLNGKPVPANPFYRDDDVTEARDFVWAYGLRNPFSLDIVDGHVMVTENGLSIDRFLEVQQGRNYLWNGQDESIAANAAYVFLDSAGPVQMEYHPAAASVFPEPYGNQFYVALSSASGIKRWSYDLDSGRMRGIPELFVQHKRGERTHPLVGLAFGPDGLYFAPILPVRNGTAAVIRVKYDPQNAHGLTLAESVDVRELAENGKELMRNKGCYGCHRVKDVFELGGTIGPALDQGDGPMVERILEKTSSPEYLESLRELDKINRPPVNRYQEARDRLAQAEGLDRARIYIKYQILEPQFDGLYSTMPNMGVSEAEAEAITRFLLADANKGLKDRIKDLLPKPTYRNLAYAFGGGLMAGFLALLGIGRLWSRWKSTR